MNRPFQKLLAVGTFLTAALFAAWLLPTRSNQSGEQQGADTITVDTIANVKPPVDTLVASAILADTSVSIYFLPTSTPDSVRRLIQRNGKWYELLANDALGPEVTQ